MKRTLFATGLAVALNALALAEPVSISKLDFEVLSSSSTGYLVGRSNEDGIPRLRTIAGATSVVGTYSYLPTRVSSAGEVVGFADVGYEEQEKDYAFVTPLGSESVLLIGAPDIMGVSSNDAHQNVVLTKSAVHIFNGSTEVAVATASDVQTFQEIVKVLSDGRTLVLLTDAGSFRYGVVAQSGLLTILPETILSSDAKLLSVGTSGKLLFSKGEDYFESDLKNPLVKISTPAPAGHEPISFSDDGGSIVSSDSSNSDRHFVLFDGTVSPNISCMIPSSAHGGASRVELTALINRRTAVLAIGYTQYVILQIPEKDLPNYCTTLKLTVGKECRNKFSSAADGGLRLKGAFNQRTKCSITASVKTGDRKASKGATILTETSFKRGKTGANGKVTFPMHFDSSGFYISVRARVAGSKDQDVSVKISSYGD